MAYGLRYCVEVVELPDGAGGMTVPSSQIISFFNSPGNPAGQTAGQPLGQASPVPGGDAPTQANFNSACANMLTDIEAKIAANLPRILAFNTGGG